MPIREQQTTNKQHAIPQSIMSVEFKIIGDLTLKQFFFLMIFAGLAYASFMLIEAFVFKWLFVLFFAGTGLCFAFLPLGDRGLDQWIVNFIKAMYLPNQYVYRKEEEVPQVFQYQNLDVLRNELITLTPTTSRRKIEAYLEQQSQPIDKLDIDEKGYILKVKEAYSQQYTNSGADGTPAVTTTVTVEEVLPVSPAPQDLTALELPAPVLREQKPETETQTPHQLPTVRPQSGEHIVQDIIVKQPHRIRHIPQPRYQEPSTDYYSPTMTPDMHSGRRFINLAPEMGRGEITLPIRGERVIRPLEEERFQAEDEKKVKQLDALLQNIKSTQEVQKRVLEAEKINQEEETKKLRQQELTNSVKEEEAKKEKIRQEEDRLKQLKEREELLVKQKQELETKRLQEEEKRKKEEEYLAQHVVQITPAQQAQNPTVANIVWGIVLNNNKQPIENVVVVIRNARKEVVRALKTGVQGRFAITTPLANGAYYIDTDRENKSGLKFPLITLEAKGEVIPTLKIVGTA
ncbi:TPA: hypothetical protein DCY43_02890 [candidate division WWE3 bacterium]|uniref:Carboxypeptidase regulatory-like domain-containing protein n=1 Tax=candidate division WWE3 bacterium TaxID=2053526 RepID=A0A351JTP9_UNCKA|nr:hypothetical protein [candidate division WWE3 bacterium]